MASLGHGICNDKQYKKLWFEQSEGARICLHWCSKLDDRTGNLMIDDHHYGFGFAAQFPAFWF